MLNKVPRLEKESERDLEIENRTKWKIDRRVVVGSSRVVEEGPFPGMNVIKMKLLLIESDGSVINKFYTICFLYLFHSLFLVWQKSLVT